MSSTLETPGIYGAPEYGLPLTARRVAVFSDVHLGRPECPYRYEGDPERLIRLIRRLRDEHDLVLINGDLFDLERGPVPFAFEREFRQLESLHAAATRELDSPGVQWITGNHDRALIGLGRAVGAVDLQLGAFRVRVEHGERFNARIKQWRPFTSFVTWTSGRVMRVGAERVFAAMKRAERALTGSGRGPSPIHAGARSWMRSAPEYDALIVGHTHNPGIHRVGRQLLLDAGSCMRTPMSWLSLDGETGSVALHIADDAGDEHVERTHLASAEDAGS